MGGDGARVPLTEIECATGILVVEDDLAARKATVRVLESAGYLATVAGTIEQARHVLDTEPEPQAVLCDLSLPDGSGAELLDWIRETRRSLCPRVFVMTGGATDDAGFRVVKSGFFQVLAKPVQPKRLLEVLASVGIAKPTPSPSRPVAGSSGGKQMRKERLLIVEDNESLAKANLRALGGDFEVALAHTVADARAALADGEHDALLLDIGLPDGSGLDLLGELRGKNAELPVVMMTGALTRENAIQAFRSRVHAYLPKPFEPEELLRTVRMAVEQGRASRVRNKLLASRFGGDEFVRDPSQTEKSFELALSKIRMVFQPIVKAADGSVFGFEALLRCDEPALAIPQRLLAAADVLGRVDELGTVVRGQVASVMRAQPDRVEAIFLNVHPTELRADLLAVSAAPLLPLAHRVVLEITERAALESGPQFDAELAQLRSAGYRLAVDDLGEGYARLGPAAMTAVCR